MCFAISTLQNELYVNWYNLSIPDANYMWTDIKKTKNFFDEMLAYVTGNVILVHIGKRAVDEEQRQEHQ